MFEDFKQAMIKEFEMMNIGFMFYYLGSEIKQEEDGIFVSQEKFARDVLMKFKMEDCIRVNTPVECGVKMSKNDEGEKISSITDVTILFDSFTHIYLVFCLCFIYIMP
jgi:hypothetical protein